MRLIRKHIAVLTLALALFAPLNLQAAGACTMKTYCGKHHSVTYNKAAIRKVSKMRGSNVEGLLWLAKRESTYRNWATNGPCKGLFQLATKQPKSKWASSYWNTNRAITYCRDRYGSVNGAIRHWNRYGWY